MPKLEPVTADDVAFVKTLFSRQRDHALIGQPDIFDPPQARGLRGTRDSEEENDERVDADLETKAAIDSQTHENLA
jgi:hypothetical protein